METPRGRCHRRSSAAPKEIELSVKSDSPRSARGSLLKRIFHAGTIVPGMRRLCMPCTPQGNWTEQDPDRANPVQIAVPWSFLCRHGARRTARRFVNPGRLPRVSAGPARHRLHLTFFHPRKVGNRMVSAPLTVRTRAVVATERSVCANNRAPERCTCKSSPSPTTDRPSRSRSDWLVDGIFGRADTRRFA